MRLAGWQGSKGRDATGSTALKHVALPRAPVRVVSRLRVLDVAWLSVPCFSPRHGGAEAGEHGH